MHDPWAFDGWTPDEPYHPLPGEPVPYQRHHAESLSRAAQFRDRAEQRRAVGRMADEPVPEQVLLDAIAAAATAPTGTALPWTFAIVTDPGVRREIAERAEVHGAPLVEAPYLLVVFQRRYFADESVGIAVGLLMAALYDAGLGAVVHPVSVMTTLLARMLGRPTSEEAFAVLSVGYPKAETRKADLVPLDEILVRI